MRHGLQSPIQNLQVSEPEQRRWKRFGTRSKPHFCRLHRPIDAVFETLEPGPRPLRLESHIVFATAEPCCHLD